MGPVLVGTFLADARSLRLWSNKGPQGTKTMLAQVVPCGPFLMEAQGAHFLSTAAMLTRMNPISIELGSEVGEGPASTEVGDRLGSPSGATGLLGS